MELIGGSRCAVPLRDANGTIIKWFGTNTNIHDQKHAEESLRESEARLNAAMTYAGIGSWEVDLVTGRVTESEQIDRCSISQRDGAAAI
jgi:PAS domain-containing protein